MMSFGGIGFLMRNSQAAMSAVFKSRFFSSGKTENSKPLLTKIKSHRATIALAEIDKRNNKFIPQTIYVLSIYRNS